MPSSGATLSVEWHPEVQTAQQPPGWVPSDALFYLAHTESGLPIRTLARRAGCHASTVLRKIRRIENRRDDQLVDKALRDLGDLHFASGVPVGTENNSKTTQKDMSMLSEVLLPVPHEGQISALTFTDKPACDSLELSVETLRFEGLRVLRRLTDPGAVLAVAMDMDKSVVVRELANGTTSRTAVVDTSVAQAMALKNWIACDMPGRVSRYRITPIGRAALSALMAEAENRARQGLSEGSARFESVPIVDKMETIGAQPAKRQRIRYCTNETPLQALARRRDKSGQAFLSEELVRAGERLREDFELSQMGPKMTQNWDSLLTGGVQAGLDCDLPPRGPASARARIALALRELGPGLGDMALRCCCYLEGLETAEQRMGWSARSGKIVLRIALQRLRRHYDGLGQAGGMIG